MPVGPEEGQVLVSSTETRGLGLSQLLSHHVTASHARPAGRGPRRPGIRVLYDTVRSSFRAVVSTYGNIVYGFCSILVVLGTVPCTTIAYGTR